MPDVIRVTRALVLTRGAADQGARARGEIAAAVPRRTLKAEVIAEVASHLRMRFVAPRRRSHRLNAMNFQTRALGFVSAARP